MMPNKISPCGRFVVLDGLHLDRNLFEAIVLWAAEHDLRIQDAIQFALCIFRDGAAVGKGADRVECVVTPAHGT